MSRKQDQRGRSKKPGRFVKLDHWMLATDAWADLRPEPRALYVEMASLYNGSNNGQIHMSVREAGRRLKSSKDTAAKALRSLDDHGFIRTVQKGGFSRKVEHATEYRLTEFNCDVTGELATKDFTRWTPEIQNAVPQGRQIVLPRRRSGPSAQTA
jgi:DNA-binding transcriptional regulator YhcF (GntR family)